MCLLGEAFRRIQSLFLCMNNQKTVDDPEATNIYSKYRRGSLWSLVMLLFFHPYMNTVLCCTFVCLTIHPFVERVISETATLLFVSGGDSNANIT